MKNKDKPHESPFFLLPESESKIKADHRRVLWQLCYKNISLYPSFLEKLQPRRPFVSKLTNIQYYLSDFTGEVCLFLIMVKRFSNVF